jgi:pimeloyl-ACP methyl ester carboxylesterase
MTSQIDIAEACRRDAAGEYGQFSEMDMAWGLSHPGISLVATRFGDVRVRQVKNPKGDIALPLVLQTDAPNHPQHYDRLLPHLRRFQSITMIEALGYGFSKPNLDFRFTIDHFTDALEDVIDHLDLDRIVLHGPCVEGYTALAYTSRHPARVAALSLAQVPEREEARKSWLPVVAVMKDDIPFVGQAAFGAKRYKYVAGAHLTTVAKSELKEVFAAIARDASAHGQCYCNASTMQGMLLASPIEFEPVNVPCLLVWGGADVTHANTDKTKSPAVLRNVTEHRLMDAGHQPELEEPEQFAGILTDWIEKNRLTI